MISLYFCSFSHLGRKHDLEGVRLSDLERETQNTWLIAMHANDPLPEYGRSDHRNLAWITSYHQKAWACQMQGKPAERGSSGQTHIDSFDKLLPQIIFWSSQKSLIHAHREIGKDGAKIPDIVKVNECSDMALISQLTREKRSPGLSLSATGKVEQTAVCRYSHSKITFFCGQRHLLSPSETRVGPWIHTENMKAVTSGGLGPRPRLIFTILWQTSPSLEPTRKLSEYIHRGLVTIGWTHLGLS